MQQRLAAHPVISASGFSPIFSNKLFYSTTNVVNSFTEPLPRTSGATPVVNTISINAFQFVMFDTDNDETPDLMYATREISNKTGESSIVKYTYNITTKLWESKGEYKNPDINMHSKFLTAEIIGGKAFIYFNAIGTASATEGPVAPLVSVPSAIYRIENNLNTDLDFSTVENLTLIATAPAKTSFRGVAFSPEVKSTPVTLTSFKGKALGLNSIRLDWATVSEKNNAHFEILHATKGDEFRLIGTVNGHNNSDKLINYSYTDVTPNVGTNYYQLNQVDFDGSSEKSKVISVENTLNATGFTVSTDENQITIFAYANATTQAKLVVIDMSGKTVATHLIQLTAGKNSRHLDISKLKKGVYTANLIQGKSIEAAKFIK